MRAGEGRGATITDRYVHKEIPGLISFRIDFFDLLAVQGTLKSLLQHHGLTVSILWHSAFLMIPLIHTGSLKTL